MKKVYYSLYKGDIELAFGTKEEIAKKMNVKDIIAKKLLRVILAEEENSVALNNS